MSIVGTQNLFHKYLLLSHSNLPDDAIRKLHGQYLLLCFGGCSFRQGGMCQAWLSCLSMAFSLPDPLQLQLVYRTRGDLLLDSDHHLSPGSGHDGD